MMAEDPPARSLVACRHEMNFRRIAIGVCVLLVVVTACSHGDRGPSSSRVASAFLSDLVSAHRRDARAYLAEDFPPGRTFGFVQFLKMEHDQLARQGIRSLGRPSQAGSRFDFAVIGRTTRATVRATIEVWVSRDRSGDWEVSNYAFVAQSVTMYPSPTALPSTS